MSLGRRNIPLMTTVTVDEQLGHFSLIRRTTTGNQEWRRGHISTQELRSWKPSFAASQASGSCVEMEWYGRGVLPLILNEPQDSERIAVSFTERQLFLSVEYCSNPADYIRMLAMAPVTSKRPSPEMVRQRLADVVEARSSFLRVNEVVITTKRTSYMRGRSHCLWLPEPLNVICLLKIHTRSISRQYGISYEAKSNDRKSF